MNDARKQKPSGGSGAKRKAGSIQHSQRGSTDRKVTPTYAELTTNRNGTTDAQRGARLEMEKRFEELRARKRAAKTSSRDGMQSPSVGSEAVASGAKGKIKAVIRAGRPVAGRHDAAEEMRKRQRFIQAKAVAERVATQPSSKTKQAHTTSGKRRAEPSPTSKKPKSTKVDAPTSNEESLIGGKSPPITAVTLRKAAAGKRKRSSKSKSLDDRDLRISHAESRSRAPGTFANRERAWRHWLDFTKKENVSPERFLQGSCERSFIVQETNLAKRYYDYLLWEGIRGKTYKDKGNNPICADPDSVMQTIGNTSKHHEWLHDVCLRYTRSKIKDLHLGCKTFLTEHLGPKEFNRKEPIEAMHLERWVLAGREKFPAVIDGRTKASEEWHDFVVRTAAVLLAWLVMFRKSEFSRASGVQYNPRIHASRYHVEWFRKGTRERDPPVRVDPCKLHELGAGSYASIKTCPSKGDQTGTAWLPVVIPWKADDHLSAGYWLSQMEMLDPLPRGRVREVPLFRLYGESRKEGRRSLEWMKTTAVDKVIVNVCKVNGLWDRRFSAHSLRHGGASCLASMGIPMHIIQLMGRWKSDSFKVYTRVNLDSTLKIASRMMMQVPKILSSGMHDGLNYLGGKSAPPS